MIKSWKLTFGIFVSVALAAPVSTAFAPLFAQEKFDASGYRINIAGRQRMLTQRMAKAACFVEVGVDKDRHLQMLADSRDLFDRTLAILRDGGGQPSLDAEKDRRTLEGLDKVKAHWETFDDAVSQILLAGEVTFEADEKILATNIVALKEMNKTVSLIEQKYANPNEVMLGNAIAINVFGRQRMLSQKAAKEFCYVVGGHHAEEEIAHLGNTQRLFEDSMQAIMKGMPAVGISKPPTQEIADQLDVVYGIWNPMNQIFTRVTAGEKPSKEDVQFIATENDRLMLEMNKAVTMYQEMEN